MIENEKRIHLDVFAILINTVGIIWQ